ncbi:protein-tyrosine sulfotransferase A isoform X2 [Eurytemora carolleeae]|uniref:protein-tyrosine sulfotransferase A isoform X1 n=1 Tax=Eurytemora carolleeae TaxID=1294199 RepID=UPI000C794EC1|nr:protein-tyrosine sulfotransferase A isoform X1 [Eurytemora carolleeae]XP_023331588.1 protein-tyrosine sulfotransferase A isoform X2 [Eurytemora carolleeae]|eukprot:XP_023331587.1 protein-tyrosine sulfotransferase A-like isoform X1 [Eurytemora affinis]
MSFKRIGNVETLTALSFLSLSILSNIQVSWFQLGPASNPDTITPGDIHQVLVPGSNTIFNKSSPFLFIGGVPKSGTTLMRVLLDIHSQISCGPETHIFIDILKLRYEWNNVESLRKRNMAAGVTLQLIDHAVSGFLLEVGARHQDVAARIPCIKEPFLLTQGGFLSEWFPNSKLIHMVRDGRAVSNSLVSRSLEFPPFSSTNHTQNLKSWTKLASG